MFADVNHGQTLSWNQPVLSNEGKFFAQENNGSLVLELTTDKHPPTTSQMATHCAKPLLCSI